MKEFYFKTSSFWVAQAGLELTILLLQVPPATTWGMHHYTWLLMLLSLSLTQVKGALAPLFLHLPPLMRWLCCHILPGSWCGTGWSKTCSANPLSKLTWFPSDWLPVWDVTSSTDRTSSIDRKALSPPGLWLLSFPSGNFLQIISLRWGSYSLDSGATPHTPIPTPTPPPPPAAGEQRGWLRPLTLQSLLCSCQW